MKTRAIVVVLLLQLIFIGSSLAQDVRYYKLTTISKDGVRQKATTSSGLFITFAKEICYISDSEGYYSSESGGKMKYSLENDKVIQYKGQCYFGNAEYNFSKDKSLLNIRAGDGNVYVYKQTTPGVSVKKSSFGNIPNANRASEVSSIPVVTPGNTSTVPPVTSGSSSSTVTLKCSTCGGTGRCGDGNLAYWDAFCHGSGVCPKCHGKGYYYETAYGVNKYMECTFCNKTGRCPRCNGTGKCSSCGGTGKK